MKYIIKDNNNKVLYCGYNRQQAIEIYNKSVYNQLSYTQVETKTGRLYL